MSIPGSQRNRPPGTQELIVWAGALLDFHRRYGDGPSGNYSKDLFDIISIDAFPQKNRTENANYTGIILSRGNCLHRICVIYVENKAGSDKKMSAVAME